MKMKNWKKTLAAVMSLVMTAGCLSSCGTKQTSGSGEEVTLTFLNCWQGSELPSGVDSEHNPVADVIAEKTGVRIKYLACTTSEIERLNLAFATNDIPDIINAPFQGAHNSHTIAIKKAASEGLLTPLNDLIEEYGPNLKDAWSTLDKDFLENDFEPENFEGEHYFFPTGVAATEADVSNNAYNVYARKDILEALGVAPESVNSSEKLYELMKKIKAGNFKDINGQDVIVSGTWHGGWTYEPFYNSYVSQRDMFSSFKHENGEIKLYQNTERYKDQILFMRKIISEGLFDLECQKQTSAIAVEKMATGKVAIVGGHYTKLKQELTGTLYATNPEMEYLPLGPIMNLDGEPYSQGQVRRKGAFGGVVMIGGNTKYPEKAMQFINFMNSEEGMLLNRYGIEGVHYTMVDGKPRLTPEWQEKYEKDPNSLKKEGIGLYGVIRLNNYISAYGESTYGVDPNEDKAYIRAKEASPLLLVDDVYSLNYVAMKYEKYDDILTLMQTGDGGLMQRAMYAATEEEALDLIEQSRDVYERGGIKEFEAWMTEHQNDGQE
ncbi:MAG: extracellular solute-binding protein [Clostridia bacterium]|nr:extracellular solute-binding protein [Clostridia bacterium]MBP3360247.1 extracellular solute-binding protein [Clostridia bacterium]